MYYIQWRKETHERPEGDIKLDWRRRKWGGLELALGRCGFNHHISHHTWLKRKRRRGWWRGREGEGEKKQRGEEKPKQTATLLKTFSLQHMFSSLIINCVLKAWTCCLLLLDVYFTFIETVCKINEWMSIGGMNADTRGGRSRWRELAICKGQKEAVSSRKNFWEEIKTMWEEWSR